MSTAAGPSHVRVLGGLIEAFRNNPSYKDLEATYEENISLRKEIDQLKIAKRQDTKDLADALREIDAAKKDAQGKGEKLEIEDKKKKELDAQHDATLQQLNAVKRRLSASEVEIKTLRGYSIEMKAAPQDEMYAPLRLTHL
jgi:chromosome segregation ATPase